MFSARRFIAVCLWLGLFAACLPGGTARAADPALEVGRPFLQNFALRDYHAHNQNWAAVQDADGVMYFGNKGVVLEYDGVSWRKIVVGQTTFVRGLAIDPRTGTIFVGAADELGYLKSGVDGEKIFVSLRSRLPEDARDFHEIRRAYATDRGIFFAADQQIMLWHDDSFRVWKLPNASTLRSFFVHGRLFVQHPDFGLLRLDDDRFVPASSDPFFRRAQMVLCVPGTEGGMVFGTAEEGLCTLQADGSVVPLPNDAAAFLKANKIRRGARLRDGSLVVATYTGGLVVLDRQGHFRAQLDESAGLQNDLVLDFYEDREGGVWLCLNSGVTRVELSSTLSIFGSVNGLRHTTIHALTRFRSTLYLGTNYGIYRIVPADPANARMAACELLPEYKRDCWGLVGYEHGFLAGGIDGVSLLDAEGHVVRLLVPDADVSLLQRSRLHPERVFLGTSHGLRSLRYEADSDHWVDEGVVTSGNTRIRSLVETAAGDLWLGTADQGILRVVSAFGTAPGAGKGTTTSFFATHGLPADQSWTRVVPWSGVGGVLFSTQGGLYRFDEPAEIFRPVSEYSARFADDTFQVGEVTDDNHGLWLAGRRDSTDGWADQELGHVTPAGNGTKASFHRLPYKIADCVGEIEKFFVEQGPAGEIVWVCGTNGAVRVEADSLREGASVAFSTLLRRAFATPGNQSSTPPESLTGQPLPFARNSVHFEFAAETFACGAAVRYQTRLEDGSGKHDWSNYTDRTVADYTNLPNGNYTFQVRARDVDGRVSAPATLRLRILPPWKRTPLAYALYGVLLIAGVIGVAHWRSRHLHARNLRLEELVAARTDELSTNQRELLRARDSAEAANRSKSSFLANMSHELRTPLNAILGYTQILLKDTALSPKNRERLKVVGQSGGHLLAMINEVLDLSKIEAGKLTLNRTDFSLGQLLDEVSTIFRPRFADKGLDFRCVRPPILPRLVHADSDKLRQVLFNLLGNAAKFTRRGEVRFEVTLAEEDRVRFEVEDTGIGIASEELSEIFVAFHQAGEKQLAAQGTGLGLAISQRFVELLGGSLAVESTLGHGSRFWFELSLPPVAAAGATPVAEDSLLGRRPVTGFRGAPRRLLIADDEPIVRWVLRELLEPLGFVVEEAVDGGTCLEHCAQHPPDVLLLDLRMDGLDGFGVARALRRNGLGGASVKIIAVSASAFESDRQQALAAGCDDFLPKPFNEEQLLATLGRVLGVEWTFGPTLESSEGKTGAVATESVPAAEEIDAMLELSRRGDILGIKKRLGALQAAGAGGCGSFVRGLEPLVASYQMDRIRDVLIKCKENGHG